jgi:AAA15 family ATPase/GTPase
MNKDDEIIPKKSKAEELLELVDSSIDNNNSIKIKSLELTNYRFFYDKDEKNNKFDFDGRNVLIYGENGSGKSSFYKALELLTKNKIEKGYFSKEKNIFSETNPSVNFTFTNDRGLTFDTDSEDPQTFELRKPDFINSLDIFKPMLDYKRLLGIHYSQVETDKINIYNMLKQTIRDFPVEYNSKETKLFDISSPTHRLEEIKMF